MAMKIILTCLLAVVCSASNAWVPLATVSEGSRTALGPLPLVSGDAMPSAKTLAFITRKDGSLVFEFVCDEPRMDLIAVTGTERDGNRVWNDDCVELFVQPGGNGYYYHVAVNPLGTVFDERETDVSWNCKGITVNSLIESNRWTATIALPFADIGGAPKDGGEWRVNVARGRRPGRETSSWSPSDAGLHNPKAFGVVRFAASPHPVVFDWRLQPPVKGRIHLAWDDGGEIPVWLDNELMPVDGSFAYSSLKDNLFRLESKNDGKVVFRAFLPVPSDPLEKLLSAASSNLDSLDTEESAVLRAETDAFNKMLREITPEGKAPFRNAIAELVARARNARVVAIFAAKGNSSRQIPYGVETSLVKLLKHSQFTGEIGGTVRLDAARCEMDAAQIVLFSGVTPLISVNAKLDGDLKAEDGSMLPASALRLRRVGYVPTVKPIYRTEFVGLWPDPLMPLVPFDVPSHSFETLWIDVRVPKGLKPALYKGTVRVAALNGDSTDIPVEVRIRNFTIPPRPCLTTSFGLGIRDRNAKWYSNFKYDDFYENMLEHRITPGHSVSLPKRISPPMANWGSVERLSITVSSDRDAELRAAIMLSDGKEIALPSHAITSRKTTVVEFPKELVAFTNIVSAQFAVARTDTAELEVVALRADGTLRMLLPLSRKTAYVANGWLKDWPTWRFEAKDQPDIPAVYEDWADFDEKFEKALVKGVTSQILRLRSSDRERAREIGRHLAEKGWSQYFHNKTFDEPVPAKFHEMNLEMARLNLPECKIKTRANPRGLPKDLLLVDIWDPEIYSFDPSRAAEEQMKGREVWWYFAYTTRHPFPNIFIDYPAIDCRILPWLTWKHNLDGLSHWHATYWPRNPWESGNTFSAANGDGSLLYPEPTAGQLIPSAGNAFGTAWRTTTCSVFSKLPRANLATVILKSYPKSGISAPLTIPSPPATASTTLIPP